MCRGSEQDGHSRVSNVVNDAIADSSVYNEVVKFVVEKPRRLFQGGLYSQTAAGWTKWEANTECRDTPLRHRNFPNQRRQQRDFSCPRGLVGSWQWLPPCFGPVQWRHWKNYLTRVWPRQTNRQSVFWSWYSLASWELEAKVDWIRTPRPREAPTITTDDITKDVRQCPASKNLFQTELKCSSLEGINKNVDWSAKDLLGLSERSTS